MKNVIVIDIDSGRDEPILIKKPGESLAEVVSMDDTLTQDLKHMAYASIFIASMLSEEDEIKAIDEIIEVVMERKNELTKNTKDSSDGEEERDI